MFDKYKRELINIEIIYPKVKRGIPKGFNTTRYWFKCQGCKEIFSVSLQRYNQGVGKTCSKICLGKSNTGINNPNYRNGTRINRVAVSIRKRLVNKFKKCQNCGFNKYPEALEVDHIIDVRFGGNAILSNLQVICANCHRYKTIKGFLPTI